MATPMAGTTGTMGGFTINGLAYDPRRIDAVVKLGDVEIWRFVNPMGMAMHPMHAHDIMWQALDRNGVAVPEWERGWKDTFMVPAHSVVRVIGRFADYTCNANDPLDSYMCHCHILEHEDNGMMSQFQVV
jgi:bilirubin oxidase